MVDYYKKIALRKAGFSILIVLVYILGTNIILPGIDSQRLLQYLANSPNLSFALNLTGFSVDRLSLFSLGMAPWMSAVILWRVLVVAKVGNLPNLTNSQSYRLKFLFCLAFGIIQGLSVISQVQTTGISGIAPWELEAILITGVTILVWLGNMNSKYGVGGPTVIIIASMSKSWLSKIVNGGSNIFSKGVTFSDIRQFILILAVIALLFIVFRFYQGELRLPLMYTMVDNSFLSQSYLAIPTNPAGGMPFMYSFSIMLFPQYLLFILNEINPSNLIIQNLYKQIKLDHILGILIFIAVLVFLTYAFAYVNIDYKEISDSLKKGGNYFSNVYPGKNTERYLFYKITTMATVSALFNAGILGVPMLMSLYWAHLSTVAYAIPTMIILMILMKEITSQFLVVYHRNKYDSFISYGI